MKTLKQARNASFARLDALHTIRPFHSSPHSMTFFTRRPAAAFALALTLPLLASAKEVTILNVSYDPTREMYQEFNAAFTNISHSRIADTERTLPACEVAIERCPDSAMLH